MKLKLSALALVLSLSTGALANETAKSDADITTAVQAALNAQPSLKEQKIAVSTKSNSKGEKEVTLSGTVPDQQMMVTAGMAAEKVPGVTFVINDINPEDYLREQAKK